MPRVARGPLAVGQRVMWTGRGKNGEHGRVTEVFDDGRCVVAWDSGPIVGYSTASIGIGVGSDYESRQIDNNGGEPVIKRIG